MLGGTNVIFLYQVDSIPYLGGTSQTWKAIKKPPSIRCNLMIKHCWNHIQNSKMWVSIWPSEQDWSPAEGLTLLHLLGLGCVLVPVAYSLPVLFSRICPRLFPCSSHHPQEFLYLEGRNPFYPAKKAEPGIFRVPDVFFTPGIYCHFLHTFWQHSL